MLKYQEFYGLKCKVFSKDSSLEQLYVYPHFSELLEELKTLAQEGGIGLLSGELGIGKTTAIRYFLSCLDNRAYHICYVGNIHHSRGVLKSVIESFGEYARYNRNDILMQASKIISKTFLEQKRRTVLVVDEAHLLEDSLLEDLRLLTNYHIDSKDPMALILAGHPSLRTKLRLPVHAALADRISLSYRLEGISAVETKKYLSNWLQQAGASPEILTQDACEAIFDYAQGIPRKINKLALNCLIKGGKEQVNPLTADYVQKVLNSLETL